MFLTKLGPEQIKQRLSFTVETDYLKDIRNSGRTPTPEAVSYTHLDVYKRQGCRLSTNDRLQRL